MNKQRIMVFFLTIISVGVIVSVLGMIISSGIAPETYPLWQIIFDTFVMFYFLGMIPYFRVQNKNDQSQLNEWFDYYFTL